MMDGIEVLKGALQTSEMNRNMMVQSGTRCNHEEKKEIKGTNPHKMQIM
jgi:hypothetical protein